MLFVFLFTGLQSTCPRQYNFTQQEETVVDFLPETFFKAEWVRDWTWENQLEGYLVTSLVPHEDWDLTMEEEQNLIGTQMEILRYVVIVPVALGEIEADEIRAEEEEERCLRGAERAEEHEFFNETLEEVRWKEDRERASRERAWYSLLGGEEILTSDSEDEQTHYWME
jgi:hypothetical protein